jgi:glyoxylase-like metal-dependent hydrolase (beta-lactamase superfamily II)
MELLNLGTRIINTYLLRIGGKLLLFCGDGAMNGFPSIKRQSIWIEDPQQYKHSWDRMAELDFELAYPGHGKPFPKGDLAKYRGALEGLRIIKVKPH